MFKNYIKIAFRNLKKHKPFSFINISGLAIGMACCILLSIYINSELSFDTYHEKGDRIFRVCEELTFKNYHGQQSATNGVIAEALKKTYSEVEEAVRLDYLSASVKYKDKQFSDRFYYSDESVFNIFAWPLIKGDPKTALSAPYTIVLTKETANKYFGNDDPIGKTLKINENEDYKVTGIIENVPRYSTYRFAGLCSFNSLYGQNETLSRILTDWTSHNFETFILLKEDINYLEFEDKIKDIYYRYVADELNAKGAKYSVFLQPLRDIYLRPYWQDFGPIMYVYIFSAVAVFVLLIACANFINLSTARSMNRAAEVGMRKVLGANQGRLINQFLSEAILLSLLSMTFAVGIILLILPAISNLAERDLIQDFFAIPWLIPGIIGVTIFVGFVAGSYPAFFISKFEPAQVMKNKSKLLKGNTLFRRVLVVTQFTISITLIIGTGLVVQQLDYLKHKDPGFNKEHVVCLPIRDQLLRQKLPILKEKIRNIPDVIDAGAASNLPGWGSAINDKIPEGYTHENMQLMNEINVDEDYLSTLGIEITQGRNFSKEYGTDSRGAVIVNETAVKRFGWSNPLGRTIKTLNIDKPNEKEWEVRKVIGVARDYHIASITQKIEPAFIANVLNHPFSFGQLRVLAVRIKPGNMHATLSNIEKIWKDTFPQKPFEYFFLDENFNEQFIRIERLRDIFFYFTFLAIFIACLGLFGMASYTAEKRTKEIGIRKTLGSSVTQIVKLLSKELIYLVIVANIIAYPIAYLLINKWLQDFPYRIEINIYTFILSTLLALIISFSTIAYQSIHAALAKPVDSLKYE
jgi:putative ABC transport system permease protein